MKSTDATVTITGNPCLTVTMTAANPVTVTFTVTAPSSTLTIDPKASTYLDPFDITDQTIDTSVQCFLYDFVKVSDLKTVTSMPTNIKLSYPGIAYTTLPSGSLTTPQVSYDFKIYGKIDLKTATAFYADLKIYVNHECYAELINNAGVPINQAYTISQPAVDMYLTKNGT